MQEKNVENEIAIVENEVPTNQELITQATDFILPEPEAVAIRAEKNKKMIAAACRVLSASDVVDFGDEPFIEHRGCKKIGNVFGLVIRLNEDVTGNIAYKKVFDDKESNNYTVYISCKIWHKNSPQNYEIYEGSCSSFHDYFAQWHTKTEMTDENGKKSKIIASAKLLPESKVQEKAVANAMQRAIKKILGFKITWEDLEQAGIKRSMCKSISFKNAKVADTAEIAELRNKTWDKLIEICQGNKDVAKATIKKHTAFNDFNGYTDINKVSEKMLVKLADKVNSEYEKYCEKLSQEGDSNE